MTTSTAAAPPVEPRPRRDSQQIRRSLSKFIGWGYVAYFVIVLPEIVVEAPTVAAWWTPAAALVAFGPGWAMLVTSYLARDARIPTVSMPLCCAAGYLMAVGTWFIAWTGQHTGGSTGTWLVTFPGLAALTLVVTPLPWSALLHLAVGLPAVQIANSWARSRQYGQLLVTDIAWGLAFSALFVLAGLMAVRTGDQLDRSYARTVRAAEESAAERERETQRKLYDRLIHDSVLAVLREAPRANADPVVSREARAALRDWSDHLDERSSAQPIGADEVVHRIRRAVANASESTGIVVDGDPGGDDAPVVPMRVSAALADAAAEAVRNARRHAGAAATVTVTVQVHRRPLMVTVADDGCGFDPAAIRAATLGLSRSIVERMRDVGGQARVHSDPGSGTTIDLCWPR